MPRHRWHGIPQYLKAHHPMAMTKEVRQLREEGYLTAKEVARQLGIGNTTLRRLEGRAYALPPRRGKRHIRLFTPTDVASIRRWLQANTRLGGQPELLSLEEVARRAGCHRQTIRSRLGTELPPGKRLTKGARGRRGFTPGEAQEIISWVKEWKRES